MNIGNFLHTIRRVWSKRSPESWLDYLRAEGTTQGSIGRVLLAFRRTGKLRKRCIHWEDEMC